MMKLAIYLLSTCFFLFFSAHANGQPPKTIFFYEIDDMVKVSVGDQVVYESGAVGYLGSVEIEVDLSKYISSGDENIIIQLINVKCPTCTSGNPWAVSYEIIDGGEEMDYQYDKGESQGGNEIVYSYTFSWNEL